MNQQEVSTMFHRITRLAAGAAVATIVATSVATAIGAASAQAAGGNLFASVSASGQPDRRTV